MKNLTDLPIKLILKIFNYLEYDDLIVLKNLNEKWTNLVGRCFEAKIVVINGFESSYKSSLYDSLYLVGRSLIGFKLNTDLHFWIRKLVLFHPDFVFDLIGFDNLIDLEIYLEVEVNENPGQLSLRIKNLKNLTIYHFLKDLKTYLDTPKLTNLVIRSSESLDQFKIIHPYSIKYLRTFEFNEAMNQMNNLEELFLTNLNIDKVGDLFNRLKRLKKLNFNFTDNDPNSTHQFIQSISLLKPTLKISFQNIELNDDLNLSELDEFRLIFLNDESVPIFMKHLDNISNLTHNYLDISNLDQISIELIQKLTNLESLRINEIKDKEKWIQLLSLPKLTEIEINSFVDQEYFNLIPKYCKFLTYLEIDRIENVEWLLQLKYLENLVTSFQFDFEMFKKLINNLNYLKMVRTNQKDVEESYEIEMKHSNVECKFGKKVNQTYSKLLFIKTIESCSFWSDLFCNIKVK